MGKRFTAGRVEWAVERFPLLKPLLKRTAGVLSGGEQQILAVARGLATEPKLLMVDELSLGLSPKAMSDVLQALVDACSTQGTSLLLVDQNVHAMVDVADRLYVLKSGVTKEVDPSTIRWSDDWLEAI
jgi:ABC-type branched-subunit amino acid transport system ATPase component